MLFGLFIFSFFSWIACWLSLVFLCLQWCTFGEDIECDFISKVISYPINYLEIVIILSLACYRGYLSEHNAWIQIPEASKVRIQLYRGSSSSFHTSPTDHMVILGRQHGTFWDTFHIVSIDHFIMECQLYATGLKDSTFHVSFAHSKLAPQVLASPAWPK